MVFYHVTLQNHVIKTSSDFMKVTLSSDFFHRHAKFGSHRHCGNEDIMVSVCHAISQDHVIKEPCDFMGGTPSR